MDASNKYVLNSHGYKLLGKGGKYYCYPGMPPAGNQWNYDATGSTQLACSRQDTYKQNMQGTSAPRSSRGSTFA